LTQTINPLFLSPTGVIGSVVIRTSTVGVFLGIIQGKDMDDTFFQTGNKDFSVDVSYLHAGTASYVSYPAHFDDPTIVVDSGGSGNSYQAYMPKLTMNGYRLRKRPTKSDTIIVLGKKYSVDTYTEDGFGITHVYLKEFRV